MSILKGIDLRTQMVGANRLELLLFQLHTPQVYGINVFKVQEVIRCPELSKMVHSHPSVIGIAQMRHQTIPVIDLSRALKMNPTPVEEYSSQFVIIADYNKRTQGFLVRNVQRIVNMNWKDILPPPKGAAGSSYFTAVTKVDEELIGILDVEKILIEITGEPWDEKEIYLPEHVSAQLKQCKILVVDDSTVARNQIKRTLEKLHIQCDVAADGAQALEYLEQLCDKGNPGDYLDLIITDVEMPNMDGYTLTTKIRANPKLKDIYIIMHTSLSGVFNQALVEKVGANKFIPKFSQNDLSESILEGLQARMFTKKAG